MKLIILILMILSIQSYMLRSRKDHQKEQYIELIRNAVKSSYSEFHHSAYNRLAYYVDTFGPRMWGSEDMADAVDALYQEITKMEFSKAVKENLGTVTSWKRGEESLTLLKPRSVPTKLNLIGLGWSPAGDVIAEVVVIRSFNELTQEKVAGKIVCFNFEWTGYYTGVAFRSQGPAQAEKFGAVGTLVRSVTGDSIGSPHTGMTSYTSLKHPAAAITVEDADMFERMQKRGQTIEVHLVIGGEQYQTTSDNIIAEITGSVYPDEILLMGGHWDSWDTGSQTGANDDGGGVMVCLEALRILQSLGLKPKRTIRFIAWSGEEMGQSNNGAQHYAENHKNENHVIAFESDLGTTKPYGFGITGGLQFTQLISYLAQQYLTGVGAERIYPNDGRQADNGALRDVTGVPVMKNKIVDNENHDFYFRYHHSAGDSMLMMDADDLDDNVVAIASIMFLIADLDDPIPKN